MARWTYTYAESYPQLGTTRCACGRVARHMGIDNRKHSGVPKCYVCSDHYPCSFCKRYFRDIDRHYAEWHPGLRRGVA